MFESNFKTIIFKKNVFGFFWKYHTVFGIDKKKRLNKSASCSEILFLSVFKTLLGILYGPVDLLISRDEKISLISSLLVGERRNESGFLFVI